MKKEKYTFSNPNIVKSRERFILHSS